MCLTNPSSSKSLKSLKSQFGLPKNKHYFSGHSLGPMPILAEQAISHTLQCWKDQGVLAWRQQDWLTLNYSLGKSISTLIGAKENEVVISDSTSVNLYKALFCALKLNNDRKILLVEKNQFPADLYIAQGLSHQHAVELKYIESEAIESQLDESVAVLLLSHVDYRSSAMHTIREITQTAHQKGILVVWDLSHSVGALPLHLHADEVDFAVGCTYKYLCGGPGSPSFIFAHGQLHNQIQSPIQGWFGHANPFAFNMDYSPKSTMSQFIGGTPYLLSLKGLQGALALFEQVDLTSLRQIAIAYSSQLIAGVNHIEDLECISPKAPARRGNHVAFKHPQAFAIYNALIAQGIFCDFREPNVLRFGINPLYQDLKSIEAGIHELVSIMQEKIYLRPIYQAKSKVNA